MRSRPRGCLSKRRSRAWFHLLAARLARGSDIDAGGHAAAKVRRPSASTPRRSARPRRGGSRRGEGAPAQRGPARGGPRGRQPPQDKRGPAGGVAGGTGGQGGRGNDLKHQKVVRSGGGVALGGGLRAGQQRR